MTIPAPDEPYSNSYAAKRSSTCSALSLSNIDTAYDTFESFSKPVSKVRKADSTLNWCYLLFMNVFLGLIMCHMFLVCLLRHAAKARHRLWGLVTACMESCVGLFAIQMFLSASESLTTGTRYGIVGDLACGSALLVLTGGALFAERNFNLSRQNVKVVEDEEAQTEPHECDKPRNDTTGLLRRRTRIVT